jgi:hypothetical protein
VKLVPPALDLFHHACHRRVNSPSDSASSYRFYLKCIRHLFRVFVSIVWINVTSSVWSQVRISMVALTTLFTPPSTCTSLITWNGNRFWQAGIEQTNDPNCFPTSFASIFRSFYSPGVCPQGWTSTTSVSGAGHAVFDLNEMNAMCCPVGYSMISSQADSSKGDLFCRRSLTGILSNVYSTTALGQGPAPENPSLTTIDAATLASPYMFQDLIQVRWQSTDTDVLNLMSSISDAAARASTASSNTSPNGSTSPMSSSISSPSSVSSSMSSSSSKIAAVDSSSSADHLSGGVIAGIAMGSVIAVLVVFGLGLFVGLRKRKSNRAAPAVEVNGSHLKSHLAHERNGTALCELDAHRDKHQPVEIGAEATRHRY